ncbi:hypothetical protein GCM10027035_41220 [Emticicia sediminis]
MGVLIFFFIAVFIAHKIYTKKGVEKLPFFFIGILFFPTSIVLIEKPLVPFPRFIILFTIILAYLENKKYSNKRISFPLKYPFLILYLCFFLIGINDFRVDLFQRIYRPLYFFLENFLVLYVTFLFVRDQKDVLVLYKWLVKCFIFFGLYGIINYLTKDNYYLDLIHYFFPKSFDFSKDYLATGGRFRISSFAYHPIYYGLLLAIIIMILLVLIYEKEVSFKMKKRYFFVIALLFVNLLLTNSRTPLIALGASISLFIAFGIGTGQKVSLFFISIFTFLLIQMFFPNSLGIISDTIDTFTTQGSKLAGSSIDMRARQLAASMVYFDKNPVFGNGFNFIIEGLGYSNDANNRVADGEFYGFESYGYKLLIEQGVLGMVGHAILFITLISFCVRKYFKVDDFGKVIVVMSVSLTVGFLLFIFGTGDMGGFKIFMPIMGINLKAILLQSRKIVRDKEVLYQTIR